MSGWALVFLGVIALGTLVTALMQVAVLISAGMVLRRLGRLVDRVEQDLQPLFAQLNAMARDASRATSLAAAQVERADQVFADLVRRLDQILDIVQTVITKPAREGAAIMAAIRATIDAVRGARARGRTRSDDDDALFI